MNTATHTLTLSPCTDVTVRRPALADAQAIEHAYMLRSMQARGPARVEARPETRTVEALQTARRDLQAARQQTAALREVLQTQGIAMRFSLAAHVATLVTLALWALA